MYLRSGRKLENPYKMAGGGEQPNLAKVLESINARLTGLTTTIQGHTTKLDAMDARLV